MVDSLKKAKIKWHCRRGMRELDLILGNFAEAHLDSMTSKQIDLFTSLLESTDPELFAWLMGSDKPSDKDLFALVEFIKLHSQAR